MVFTRKIKKDSGTYLARVENYRKDGKVKQRVIKYLGREINGKPVRRVRTSSIGVESAKRYGDVLCVDKIARDLGLDELFEKNVLLLRQRGVQLGDDDAVDVELRIEAQADGTLSWRIAFPRSASLLARRAKNLRIRISSTASA